MRSASNFSTCRAWHSNRRVRRESWPHSLPAPERAERAIWGGRSRAVLTRRSARRRGFASRARTEHEHEHATCFNLKGKGLVVITSCGHAGIINTIKQAQEVSGINKLFALVGGFHLAGR